MAEEALRLAAEVVDRFSAPIRDMTRQLSDLNKLAQKQSKEGVAYNKEHVKSFQSLQQSMHEFSNKLKGELAPAMAGLGVGAISLGGAIAAITTAVNDFGVNARKLGYLSRESGFGPEQIRVWEGVGDAIGATGEAMDEFISSFSQKMDQMRLWRGPLADWFKGQPNPDIRALGQALHDSTNNVVAFDDILSILSDKTGRYTVVQKEYLAQIAGLPKQFAYAGERVKEFYKAIEAETKPLLPGWEERALQFNLAMAKMKAAVKSLWDQAGDTFAPSFTKFLDETRTFLDENRPQIIQFFRDIGEWVRGGNWAGFAHDVRAVASALNTGAQALGGWKNVAEGLVAIKLVSWLGGVAGAFAAIGTAAAASMPALAPFLAAIAAIKGAEELVKNPLGALGLKGPRSIGGNIKELWGMMTGAPPASAKKMSYSPQEAASLIKGSFGGFESIGPNPLRAAQSSIRQGTRSNFPAEETLGGTDAINVIAVGTRKGVADGLWDFYNSYKALTQGGGGPGGMFGGGGGGFGGTGGTGARRASLEEGGAAETGAGPGAIAPMGGAAAAAAGAAVGTGGFLQAQRARMAAEVKNNPQLAKELAGVAILEDAHDPEGVIESLANRAAYTGKSLNSLIHGGFYGPVNRGQLPGAMRQLEGNPKLSARVQGAIDRVWAGENRLKGATDQGMPGDPNARWPGGRISPPGASRGAIYNDWAGGPGGHEGARRFREAQQAAVAAAERIRASSAGSPFGGDWSIPSSALQPRSSLMDDARRAGVVGSPQQNKISGEASLAIKLAGGLALSGGVKTGGDLFKSVSVERGRTPHAEMS